MKIYIIPHTHWDREWYFTNETSQVLWNFNLDNYLNNDHKISKFYLDGQVSLVEDYLKHANPSNKKKFIEQIKNRQLIVGPWYSQPDVFNSLGETTIRNLEIAQSLLFGWGFTGTQTLYCPDTFGFTDNLPQIANLFGFKEFVFWRGVAKQLYEHDAFMWKGIEGSELKCYRYKFGYWILGSKFPWNQLTKNNIKEQAEIFWKDFMVSDIFDHLKSQAAKQCGTVMIPFGGDQAPLHPLTNDFFAELNKITSHEWEIGEFEDFLKILKPSLDIEGILDYGFDSKIHRTITTSRYDFKKLFRENEIALYHQLEPLELYYKYCDPSYVINNDDIVKQLCLMQAHDVLGGCVTDNVYLASYQKLLDIKEKIEAKKDLLLKQLGLQMELKPNNILVFNPHTSTDAHSCIQHTVYTSKKLQGYFTNADYSVCVLNSKIYSDIDNTYISELIILNKKLTPMNLHILNLDQLNPQLYGIEQITTNCANYNKFIIKRDQGDLFDADEITDETIKVTNDVIEEKTLSFEDINITEINGKLKTDENVSPYYIRVIDLPNNEQEIKIEIQNNFKNIILKWSPNQTYNQPRFLQHLAIQKYKPRVVDDWKNSGYKDDPLGVEKNSGLIFDNCSYICTKGTNEFKLENDRLIITLYRSTGVLGKANLNTRPGVASGLTDHLISTPLGQLIKPLVFDFKLGKHNNNVDQKLNSFYKKPIVFQVASNNLIASKMERFVFLKQPFIIKELKLELPSGFVSSLRSDDKGRPFVTVVNFVEMGQGKDYNKIRRFELAYEK